MAYFPARPLNFAAAASLKSVVTRALAPHWGALLALALFLIVGLAVLDDYGVTWDESSQRRIAQTNLRYLANNDLIAFLGGFRVDSDKLYGIAFEAPLLLAERAFALEDNRAIILSRHILSRLVYLVGGLFAYLLALRLFGGRLLALTAMLIFLLHPRLYAHAFFNSKDIPFFVMFAVALFLTHRAFRRDTLWAFTLLGVGVGVLVNLRVMGMVLLAAIPSMRALDLAFAQGWAERKRIILSAGAFALTAALTAYALLPYLWADPAGRAVEWWTTLSDHPTTLGELFRGTIYRSDEFPADYVPVWFSITSPPFALALGLVGAGAILAGAVRAPQIAMRNGNLRFGLLLVGCVAAPVAAVVLLDANIYNAWRHVYFLWAPFALLAAFGLAALTRDLGRPRLRAAVYGAAGLGLAATALSMALIHPNQHLYFNALVDRVTPERLRTQHQMDYWQLASRQAVEWLLQSGLVPPDGASIANRLSLGMRILPKADRDRLSRGAGLDAFVLKREFEQGVFERPDALVLRRFQIYNNTIMTIERKSGLQELYEATAGREPLIDSVFDFHLLDEGGMALVKQPCAPSFIERRRLRLRITPVDPDDLPPWRMDEGFEEQQWSLENYGAAFDGKCVARIPLPNYPVAEFHATWSSDLVSDAEGRETMRRAREEGRLLARADQEVYLSGNDLVYIRDSCDPAGTERAFYVDIVPERAADLPGARRQQGYEQFRFDFHQRGAFVGGACVTAFALPDYRVSSVRTGQSAPEEADAWRAEFSLNPEPYRSAYLSAVQGAPLARGVFDVYMADDALVYAKESCDWNDTEARFFLHLEPERVEDLPEGRREHRFDNLDFAFFGRGGYFDGKCATRVKLPEYPIASVRTGQFGSAGEIWSAEFD